MLRIISGKYRSLQIIRPKNDKTRPTKDNIREAIFNTIRFELNESIILDLFAGSGALAFEAISNGAMKAVLVDNNIEAIKAIQYNCQSLKLNNADIYKMNALDFLKNKKGRIFNFIFLDPPYLEYDLVNLCLDLISANNFLHRNGLIILETDNIAKITIPESFCIQKQKKYGKTTILYIANNN